MTRALEGIQACVFDAYGTLFDFASAAARCPDVPAESRAALTTLWRDKQLQYSVAAHDSRTATPTSGRSPATGSTSRSKASASTRLRIARRDSWTSISASSPSPRFLPSSRALRKAGFRTAILSNGSPTMLDALVKRSKLESYVRRRPLSRRRSAPSRPIRKRLSIRAWTRSACEAKRDRLPVLQRLGRARRVGFRHASRLVQPLRPAPRAPSRRPRLRDPDPGRTAGAARRPTLLTGPPPATRKRRS